MRLIRALVNVVSLLFGIAITASAVVAEEWLSSQELADELKVPVSTVHAWRYRHRAPRAYTIGRYLRFKRSDVDRWLEQRADEPPDAA